MRVFLAVTASALLAAFAVAQQSSQEHAGTPVVQHAGAQIMPATQGATVSHQVGEQVNGAQFSGAQFSSFQTMPFQTMRVQGVSFDNVPGLGFDYTHLAAVTRGQPQQASNFNAVTPFGFQGVLFWPPAVQPTVVIVQQPVEQPVIEVRPRATRRARYVESLPDAEADVETESASESLAVPAPRERTPAQRTPAARPAEPAPKQVASAPQDVAQYVFVRRDGTLIFGVAYSWEKGMLWYVTAEGLRRSVAGNALDLDATQQFNEQRGLSFRSPV
jgi:hypothetical protein